LLSERLGQQFVIENRPGAGGNLAVEAALKAAPDGYTLLMIGSNNAWNVTLYDNLSFDFLRDIAPVASIVRTVGVLVVHPSVPTGLPRIAMTHYSTARLVPSTNCSNKGRKFSSDPSFPSARTRKAR
jgi:hypothetical protein